MKKFETAFIQRGIAPEIGMNQDAKTVVYACLIGGSWDYTPEFRIEGDEDLKYFDPVYIVEVTHPAIFAGSQNEFTSTIIEFAKKELRKVGALKVFDTKARGKEEFLVKI